MNAFWMPNIRTVRVTPPPPGSRPSVTSGKPTTSALDVGGDAVVARQRDLQAAAERRAVDGGDDRLTEGLQRRRSFLIPSTVLKNSPRPPAGLDHGLRSPPAKKVFFALVMTTPVIVSFSATRRSTALCIDSL